MFHQQFYIGSVPFLWLWPIPLQCSHTKRAKDLFQFLGHWIFQTYDPFFLEKGTDTVCFISGKGETVKNQKANSSFICAFILPLSLCNLQCRKEVLVSLVSWAIPKESIHWRHGSRWQLWLRTIRLVEECALPQHETTAEESNSSGTICLHLYNYLKAFMSPLLPGLSPTLLAIVKPQGCW